jgi:diguanylate cyclase (GGDEF)-like protein
MIRVLLAGPELVDSAECRLLLEANGFEINSCTALQGAVFSVLEDPPDLLIVEKGFLGNGDQALIRAVKACLQKTNIPIILVVSREEMMNGLDWDLFPVDGLVVKPIVPEFLLTRIRLAHARMNRVFDNNPLSKLPGNTSILKRIQTTLDAQNGAAIGYIDIDNFKPYNDHYGFSQGDEVLLMVARIMVNVIDEIARDGSFVGHIGGDDFVFIVKEEKIEPVCRRIIANFSAVRNMFIAPEDVKRGGFVEKDRQGKITEFGLLSISISVIPTSHGKFKHFGEVSAAASQLKHKVKELPGNNYIIDRRLGYYPPTQNLRSKAPELTIKC